MKMGGYFRGVKCNFPHIYSGCMIMAIFGNIFKESLVFINIDHGNNISIVDL